MTHPRRKADESEAGGGLSIDLACFVPCFAAQLSEPSRTAVFEKSWAPRRFFAEMHIMKLLAWGEKRDQRTRSKRMD